MEDELFRGMSVEDIRIIFNEDNINVYNDGKYVGQIECSINPYHTEHYYLNLQLQYHDLEVSAVIFNQLRQKLDKPMQVMISSKDRGVVSFVKAAGFCCKRKCYEIEASEGDYIGKKIEEPLLSSTVGQVIYAKCCEIMLDRYILTHKGINPWTGSKENFFMMLPKDVFYEVENEKIRNIAFIEDNEIAYVYGVDREGFETFSQKLITILLKQYENIMFEADDCDEYAMGLKKLFVNQSEESFDTYIL